MSGHQKPSPLTSKAQPTRAWTSMLIWPARSTTKAGQTGIRRRASSRFVAMVMLPGRAVMPRGRVVMPLGRVATLRGRVVTYQLVRRLCFVVGWLCLVVGWLRFVVRRLRFMVGWLCLVVGRLRFVVRRLRLVVGRLCLVVRQYCKCAFASAFANVQNMPSATAAVRINNWVEDRRITHSPSHCSPRFKKPRVSIN